MTSDPPLPADPLLGLPGGRARLATIEAAAVAGIVCALGWGIALGGLLAAPGLDATDADIVRYYSNPDTARTAFALLQVLVVATIGFLWFVGVVRGRLGEHEPRLFGTVFLGGGILIAGLVFIGTAALAAPSILTGASGKPPDPGAASMSRALADITLSVFGPRVAALVMFSTAGLGRKTRALPRWLIYLTYLMGLGELVNINHQPVERVRLPGLDRAGQRHPAGTAPAPRIRARRHLPRPCAVNVGITRHAVGTGRSL